MPIKTRKVTPRMAEANRKNAQKSTGPRTPEGKQRVAYNALQHGFYAKPSLRFMLATGEDPKELEQILTGLVESFHLLHPCPADVGGGLAAERWKNPRKLLAVHPLQQQLQGFRILLYTINPPCGATSCATASARPSKRSRTSWTT